MSVRVREWDGFCRDLQARERGAIERLLDLGLYAQGFDTAYRCCGHQRATPRLQGCDAGRLRSSPNFGTVM
jgi:hypothetical protein